MIFILNRLKFFAKVQITRWKRVEKKKKMYEYYLKLLIINIDMLNVEKGKKL